MNEQDHTGRNIAIACTAVVSVVMLLFLLLIVVFGGSISTSCPGSESITAQGQAPVVMNADYKAPEHSPDPVAEKIASFAESVALDDSHGYSQPRRNGNPDYDCSSLVYYAVKSAGVQGLPQSAFSTFTMGAALQAVGFQHLSWSGVPSRAQAELKRGDIVVNRVQHTEVYVGGGLFAGARHAYPGGIDDGMPGDQGKGSDQEIGISSDISTGMVEVYRHDATSSPPAATPSAPLTIGTSIEDTSVACGTTSTTTTGVNAVTDGSIESAKTVAKQLVNQQYEHDSDRQYSCLVQLWEHESGWRVNAENPSSGAYGIPQALPGSKMATTGSDWKTNATTQIMWGLEYIKKRPDYGSPCAAWDKWQSRSPHWY
jgi:cell wall-associated NlpC family hydrolase